MDWKKKKRLIWRLFGVEVLLLLAGNILIAILPVLGFVALAFGLGICVALMGYCMIDYNKDMKAQEKTFKYDPQVYPIALHVVFSADLKSALSGYEESDGSSIRDNEWGNSNAFTYYNIRECETHLAVILVVFRDKEEVDPGTVAHEAKHAADRIFDHIGEDNTRHESHAYLVEWVVNCINKALFNER